MLWDKKKIQLQCTPLEKAKCVRGERKDFDFKEWDSHPISDPGELRDKLNSMNLVGRVISDIRFTSHVYNMTEDNIEDVLWNTTEGYPEELHQYISQIDNVNDLFPFPLYMEMDEPMLIKFEDGDQFEILTPVEERFNISMNKIPWNAKGTINIENINGSVLFGICKGKKITAVETITDSYTSGEEYIKAVRFSWEDNRSTFYLNIGSEYHDYMVALIYQKWND